MSARQRLEDRINDFSESRRHITVPESQDAKASRPQEFVSPSVVSDLLEMLTAVELDDDFSVERNEVADVEANRMLSPKLEATKLTAPKTTPEQSLRVGLAFSKGTDMTKHPSNLSMSLGVNMFIPQPLRAIRSDPSAAMRWRHLPI